ncbi:hypothetical protein BAY59_27440 [Prauserella coralliicola]|nr:hypothetical protein BAY59_27440 [Prauserella coralliicola]
MKNRTKALLREGKRALGTWGMLADPTAIELAGIAGLDFVQVDMEHTARDLPTIEHMARAADVVGITLLVRVPENNPKTILRVLETGVQGIVVPQLESGEDAARAVAAMRYPLGGERGVCSITRASRYGSLRPQFAEYVESADRELLLVGLIETAAGVENIEDILAAGVEVAFVGRRDLSGSFGVHGAVEHPSVLEAQDKVIKAVATHGNAWAGLVPYRNPGKQEWITHDAPFLAYRNDISLLLEAYQNAVHMLGRESASAGGQDGQR